MVGSQTLNPIRVNHIGYLPGSTKVFTIKSPPEETFRVYYLKDTAFTEVYEGKLVREEGEMESGWLGDFSAINTEGNYQIRCGCLNSRRFSIWRKIFDPATRLMLGYFTWQRCGSSLGWADQCHQEDGILKDSGRQIDLRGGYHQSCDLRKSPAGISVGLLGFLKYALLYEPHWDTGCIADEIMWACDHYLKVIQVDGSLYNTLGAPFGWGGRTYYQNPAPASAHWNTLRVLTMGSHYLQARDADRAGRYLTAARKIWDYLVSSKRPEGAYHHPDTLPRGMDAEHSFIAAHKGSTSDWCYRLSAAADFYRATREKRWLKEIETAGKELLACFASDRNSDNPAASFLKLDKNSDHLLESTSGYGWLGGGMLSFCDALEILPDSNYASSWRERLSDVVRQYLVMSGRNIWRRIPIMYSETDMDRKTGHLIPGQKPLTVRDKNRNLHPAGWISNGTAKIDCYYSYGGDKGRKFPVSSGLYRLILLRRAARLLAEPTCEAVVQRNIDYVLGANPMDASHVEGVGFNQTPVPVFGQFFPSTPQIPGAINIGFDSNDHASSYNNGAEYDMPCVGMMMWLLADMLSFH